MPAFIKLASKGEAPAHDEAKEFTCGEKTICLANVAGKLVAMDNVCLHRGGPLGQGIVDGGKIVCPWHGWQYDPATGAAAHNPGAKVQVYPVKLDSEDILIEL
ncbi:MAG TPA: Rieske (2Fe-2S) protein [Terriglobales bacterium]|nr:Rieske (2Fe-2S) protein [Terriglobales bacterium]